MNKFFKLALVLSIIAFIIVYIPIDYVTPKVKDYYDTYDMIVKSNCSSDQYKKFWRFAVLFKDLDKEQLAGQANYTNQNNFQAIIFLNKNLWNEANENEKVSLLFHELTHVYFGYPDLYESIYYDHFMYFQSRDHVSVFKTYEQLKVLTEALCKK